MEYINFNKVPLVEEFINSHGQTIDEIAERTEKAEYFSTLKIYFVNERNCSKQFIHLFDFSERNFFFKIVANIIAYHERNCDELNLSKEERFAMIAHEFGHLILVPMEEEDFLKRELYADDMAVQLGLKNHLVSGLIKIFLYPSVWTQKKEEKYHNFSSRS